MTVKSTSAKPPAQLQKTRKSCRYVNGPLYFPDQVYPKPNNYFGPIILLLNSLTVFYITYKGWTDPTLTGFFQAVLVHGLSYGLDVLNSDATYYNILRLRHHGYTDFQIAATFIWSCIYVSIPLFLNAAVHHSQHPDFDLFDDFGFNFWLTLSKDLLIGVVTSDLVFYTIHRMLHRSLAEYHFMHHVCIKTSLTAAMFIHPVDFFFETQSGFLSAIPLYLFVTSNIKSHLIVGPFLSAWYNGSHDEWWQSQHARHHAYCNSHYWAYYNDEGKADKEDRVRRMVFEHDVKIE